MLMLNQKAKAMAPLFGALIFIGGAIVACGGGSGSSKGKPLSPDTASEEKDDPDASLPGFSSNDPDGGGDKGGGNAAILQGNEDGAQALLKQFVAPNADHAALTRSLRPTTSDYKTLFDAQTAPKVEAAQAKDWESGKAVIKPAKDTQTEIKIWSATGSDLAKGTGNAKEFPGGYKKVAKHLTPTQLFFRFKFVEAGQDKGTAYDGLAFVNGHWVIAPKPWKAIDGATAGKDDDDGTGPSTPEPTQKPRPKPKGGGKGPKKK
jgi:hypothetical protein